MSGQKSMPLQYVEPRIRFLDDLMKNNRVESS